MSLLGALTPLGKVARSQKIWFQCLVSYTVAGSLAAGLIGMLLGLAGGWLRMGHSQFIFYCISLLCLMLAAREWGWAHFDLPQAKCQTEKWWAHEFGFVIASAMWGFHIGLGFATRMTYGGFWILTAVALVLANPLYGALLMLAYWLGRALPVWVAPRLVLPDQNIEQLPEGILATETTLRNLVGFALVWLAGVSVLFAIHAGRGWPLIAIAGVELL